MTKVNNKLLLYVENLQILCKQNFIRGTTNLEDILCLCVPFDQLNKLLN